MDMPEPEPDPQLNFNSMTDASISHKSPKVESPYPVNLRLEAIPSTYGPIEEQISLPEQSHSFTSSDNDNSPSNSIPDEHNHLLTTEGP